jgi:putative tricarboxylic transport membrane protein
MRDIQSNFAQGFSLVLVGLLFIYNFSKIIFILTKILVPLALTFTVLGSMTLLGLYFDAGLMFCK